MSWQFCWAFVSTRSYHSFLKHCYILGISPFVTTGNCQRDKVHYNIYKKYWLMRVQWVFREQYVLFWSLRSVSSSALVMIMSWPSVALQKTVFPINFQRDLCAQYHLSKYHWLLNESPSCQPVKLTMVWSSHAAVPPLPGQGRKGSWPSGKQHLLQGRISATSPCSWVLGKQTSQRHTTAGRRASPSARWAQCPVSGSNWCFRDWWGKDTIERRCLC